MSRIFGDGLLPGYDDGSSAALLFDYNMANIVGTADLGGSTESGSAIYTARGGAGTYQSRDIDTPRGFATGTAGVLRLGSRGTETVCRINCPIYKGADAAHGVMLGMVISGGLLTGYHLIALNAGGTSVRIDKFIADAYSVVNAGDAITVDPAAGYWLSHHMSGADAVLRILSEDESTEIYSTTHVSGLPLGEYAINNTGGSGSVPGTLSNRIRTKGLRT
jgi:hypothetical protein